MSKSIESFSESSFTPSVSRGEALEQRYRRSVDSLRRLPHPLTRKLPKIRGLKSSGKFIDGQENVLIRIGETMRDSACVFKYGNDVLYVMDDKAETIVDASGVNHSAQGVLANIMVYEEETKTTGVIEFLAPSSVLNAAFRSSTVKGMLPEITYLAKTPVFGPEFTLLQGPGFHPCGIMVLSQRIDPTSFTLLRESEAVDRLPPLLHQLLRRFCFRSNADVANTLAVLLTSVLMNHCVGFARALIIVDGNRPNVGKTLLLQTLGVVMDGEVAPGIPYVPNDEELQKRIIARIQRSRSRLLFLDNAKTTLSGAVSSPVLESLSSDSMISGRILGTSTEVAIANDFLFGLTMNCSNVSPDLLSRAMPIQLHFEDGDPRHRKFNNEDPIQFARENREGILAELLGMVDYWISQGRPQVPSPHRCHKWASLIGGVLHACGFPEFLTNFEIAAEEFDAQTEELHELFDSVCADHPPQMTIPGTTIRLPADPLPTGKWGEYLRDIPSHAAVIGQAKGKGIGMQARRVLGVYVNCVFEFANEHGSGKAVLRSEPMRGRQTGYFFDVIFTESDAPVTSEDDPGEIPM